MDSNLFSPMVLTTIVAVCLALGSYVHQHAHRGALPPGPRGFPIVGSMFDFDRRRPLAKLSDWHTAYGELVYFRILGRRILVLNSLDAALTLQEKRAAIYSDRPRRVMAELSGYDQVTTLRVLYDDNVKTAKKHLHLQFSRSSIAKHYGGQERIAQKFCELLTSDPKAFLQHSRDCTVFAIRDVFYGDQAIFGHMDRFDELEVEVLNQFTKMVSPSEYLVDSLPILQYLPEWFPGTAFHRQARQNRTQIGRFVNEAFNAVKQQVAEGVALPCFVSDILSSEETMTPESENILKHGATAAYGAGFETTVAVIYVFFLTMVLYPEVQARAKAELDAVVGPAGIPSFADRSSLPYIEAIVAEVLRWRPPIPFAWRCLREDDSYRGYVIPGGTLVTVNVRALTHDPAWYPEPDEFRPERFLDVKRQFSTASVPDPRRFVFGFGRRSCPGNYLADNFLFIVIASTLAAFTISPAFDDDGNPITPSSEYTPTFGGICHPTPFRCTIVPRARA
ncbi:hypothetical protein V8D89_005362 [Ganoderma adspersum]